MAASDGRPARRRRGWLRGAGACAVVALVAAACGSASPNASNKTTTTAAAGSSTTAGGSSSTTSGGSSSQPAKGAPITFGDVGTFSGPSAFIGNTFGLSAAIPAVWAINHAGGVLGHPVKLKLVDDKNDPADAVPAVEKMLATTPNLAVVIGPLTTVGPTIVPILNKAKVTMMSVAGEDQFNHNTAKYFWRYFPPDSANGVAMALWAKQHGETRVATVFTADAGAQGDLPGVLAGAKALGLNVVDKVTLEAGQPNYDSTVVSLLSKNPQVIMTETDPTTGATFYGELSQLEHKSIPIIGTQTEVDPSWLSVVAKSYGTSKFAKDFVGMAQSNAAPNPGDQFYQKALLANASKVKNPKQWFDNPIVQANFAAVIIPALAMTAAHSTDPSVYNSYIPKVTNPGPGKTTVYSYAQGVKLLKEGKQISFVSAHGPMTWNQWHNAFGGYTVDAYTGSGQIKPVGSFTQKAIAKYAPSA